MSPLTTSGSDRFRDGSGGRSLGYNIKIYQYYNYEFGVPTLVIFIVLNFESKVVVWVFD